MATKNRLRTRVLRELEREAEREGRLICIQGHCTTIRDVLCQLVGDCAPEVSGSAGGGSLDAGAGGGGGGVGSETMGDA